jgi:hypothetical protein
LGKGLTTPHHKNKEMKLVSKYYTGPWTWQALVDMVINLQVSCKMNFFTILSFPFSFILSAGGVAQ